MLTQIRERSTGWVAWVIVILITIPFALWGIQSYFENVAEIPVATVNGEEIPRYTFQNQLSQRRQAASQSGGTLPPESASMRSAVVKQLVDQQLIRQYAHEGDYRFSDQALKDRIESSSVFLSDGKFDPILYRNLLRSNGYTVSSYENLERQNASVGQLYSAIAESAFVTEQETNRLLELQTQTRKSNYAIVPVSRFAAKITIKNAEAEKDYKNNLFSHQKPARIKVDYIELSVDNLAKTIEPSQQEINEVYEQSRERYKQAEARKASHILFSVDAEASDDKRKKVRATAEKVLKQAKKGSDFAKLAKEHSADPGSKGRGGDLGVVARGQMVKPFEDAVFTMTNGEIRGLIETRFGYHIIKLTELTKERQKPFAEVRKEVEAEAKRIQAENQFSELGESFQNLVFENPESLSIVAEELGLKVKQSDWFTQQSGKGIAEQQEVRAAAFSKDVLDDLNSSAIELGFERMVAIHKATHQPAKTIPFAKVSASIKARLKSQQARKQLKELGEQLVADLKEGKLTWSNLLKKQKIKSTALATQRSKVKAELNSLGTAVFSQSPPSADSSGYGGVFLNSGDYAIYSLNKVEFGKINKVDESKRSGLESQLLARDGSGAYQSLLESLRQYADIYIDQRQIDTSTSDFQDEYLNYDTNY